MAGNDQYHTNYLEDFYQYHAGTTLCLRTCLSSITSGSRIIWIKSFQKLLSMALQYRKKSLKKVQRPEPTHKQALTNANMAYISKLTNLKHEPSIR